MSASIKLLIQSAEKFYPLITKEISDQSSKRYNNETLTLEELDKWKNVEFPTILKNRQATSSVMITKDELVLLMDWKLAKGKFRPTLPKLIKSNDNETVKNVTKDGIEIFLQYVNSTKDLSITESQLPEFQKAVKLSFKKLCELRGVGPATASLILSTLSAITTRAPPFFSDESFMYFVLDPNRPETRIKYNVKEYTEELLPLYFKILSQDEELNMDKIEKGGWSLKMYEMNRINLLADIQLPFEVDEKHIFKFVDDIEETVKTENGANTKKDSREDDEKKEDVSAPKQKKQRRK